MRIVLEVAIDIPVVGSHVDKATTREIEEDGLIHTYLLTAHSLSDGGGNGMTALGSGDDAFGTCEEHT